MSESEIWIEPDSGEEDEWDFEWVNMERLDWPSEALWTYRVQKGSSND